MWKVVVLVLLAIVAYLLWSANARVIGGGMAADTNIAVIMVLKTPIGVQEMRKKYIKTDSQPPHITLGYLRPNFDESELLRHLRRARPNPVLFNKWKHTKTFIGLIPSNTQAIDRVIRPIKRYIKSGPRGGYHMSLAYRAGSAPLDEYTHKKAHKLIETPIICPVREIRIAKRRPGQPWQKYKSVVYD